MGGKRKLFWRVKTGAGKYILRVSRPNGECFQNLVSNPDIPFSQEIQIDTTSVVILSLLLFALFKLLFYFIISIFYFIFSINDTKDKKIT